MGKIICLMGKSSCGKDTIYKRLLADEELQLVRLVPYTTRPIRIKERDGQDYHFVDENTYLDMKDKGLILEERAYDTMHGIWRYFTAGDNELISGDEVYLYIGTLEAYVSLCESLGRYNMLPIYIEVDDGLRLERALKRERKQEEPKYEEMCRRFLADSVDFSKEKIKEASIERSFVNDELKDCLKAITKYIHENLE